MLVMELLQVHLAVEDFFIMFGVMVYDLVINIFIILFQALNNLRIIIFECSLDVGNGAHVFKIGVISNYEIPVKVFDLALTQT